MRHPFRHLVIALVVATILPAARAGDLILKKDGSWHISSPAGTTVTKADLDASKVLVVGEDYDFTYYEITLTRGNRQRLNTADIAEIVRGETDANYSAALDALASGDAEAALERLDQTIRSPRAAWVPQYAMYARIEALRIIGAADRALAAIDELEAKFKKTKFVRDCARLRGQILLDDKGDIEAAKKALAQIASVPGATDVDKAAAEYWQIYCDQYVGQKSSDKAALETARRRYADLLERIDRKKGYEEVAARARYGVGSCLNVLGKYDEAIAYFEGIVASSKDPTVLPGAYIGLGDAYFKTEKYVDARRAYLRVVVLWPESSSFHARALVQAGNCFWLVRDKDFKQNAARELRECINRYPTSSEAAEARKLLAKL